MNKNEHIMIHRHTSRLRTRGNHSSKIKYKSFMYDKAMIRRTYDGTSIHDRLGKQVSHTCNQPNGCVVDTW